MSYYTTGLTSSQIIALCKVGQIVNPLNYYLAGGTALSIYYGHRQSVDLDWFTPLKMGDPLMLAQLLRDKGVPFATDSTESGTLYGSVDKVRLSFLEYHYPLLGALSFWEEVPCYLAALDDIACMKLAAVAQRGYRKDFIDVFTLIQNHKSLQELLALYQKKYQVDNIVPVLTGLTYFDDAEKDVDPALWNTSWSTVKQQMTHWVRQI